MHNDFSGKVGGLIKKQQDLVIGVFLIVNIIVAYTDGNNK